MCKVVDSFNVWEKEKEMFGVKWLSFIKEKFKRNLMV